jgi:hypothetical protein
LTPPRQRSCLQLPGAKVPFVQKHRAKVPFVQKHRAKVPFVMTPKKMLLALAAFAIIAATVPSAANFGADDVPISAARAATVMKTETGTSAATSYALAGVFGILVVLFSIGSTAQRVKYMNVVLNSTDNVLTPLHWVLDRLILWPAIISIWFQPQLSWPMPWNVTYPQLLDALVKFYCERFPQEGGKHPFALTEDAFAEMMEKRQNTHTMIPFNLKWLGAFIRSYPPLTKPLVSLVLMPVLRWFVGPMELHLDDEQDVGIQIHKCRFLIQAREIYGDQKGNELCVKQCAIAMEQIWRERVGIETYLEPNLETTGCTIHAKPRPEGTRPYLPCASLDW